MNKDLPFGHAYDARDAAEVVHHDPGEGFDDTQPAHREIMFFVVASVVTLLVVIGALQLYFDGVWDVRTGEERAVPSSRLEDLRNLESWRLTHYEYATPAQTRVRIPLERARELFLEEAARGESFYPGLPTAPVVEEEQQEAEAVAEGVQP